MLKTNKKVGKTLHTTSAGDGSGGIDVITRNHSNNNAGALALSDSVGHFSSHRILNTADADTSEIRDDLGLVLVPVDGAAHRLLVIERLLIGRHVVLVGHANGSQAVRRHRLDDGAVDLGVVGRRERRWSVVDHHVRAFVEDHFRGAFAEEANCAWDCRVTDAR